MNSDTTLCDDIIDIVVNAYDGGSDDSDDSGNDSDDLELGIEILQTQKMNTTQFAFRASSRALKSFNNKR